MREIVMWRWIFGLALVPAAMLAWFVDGPDAGIPFLALSFLGAYPLGLLIVFVLSFVAMCVWLLARNAWDFTLRLLGLREDPGAG